MANSKGELNPAGDHTRPLTLSVQLVVPMPGVLQVMSHSKFQRTGPTPELVVIAADCASRMPVRSAAPATVPSRTWKVSVGVPVLEKLPAANRDTLRPQ